MDEQTLKLVQRYPELLGQFLAENNFEEWVTGQAKDLEISKLQATIEAGKEAEKQLLILVK